VCAARKYEGSNGGFDLAQLRTSATLYSYTPKPVLCKVVLDGGLRTGLAAGWTGGPENARGEEGAAEGSRQGRRAAGGEGRETLLSLSAKGSRYLLYCTPYCTVGRNESTQMKAARADDGSKEAYAGLCRASMTPGRGRARNPDEARENHPGAHSPTPRPALRSRRRGKTQKRQSAELGVGATTRGKLRS